MQYKAQHICVISIPIYRRWRLFLFHSDAAVRLIAPNGLDATVATAVVSIEFIPQRILLVAILVVIFRRIKLAGDNDLRRDEFVEYAGIFDLSF